TWCSAIPRVAGLLGAKTRSWIPQPKLGRITRSPSAVERMIWIASSTLASYSATPNGPVSPSLATGKRQPRPKKSVILSSPDQHRGVALYDVVLWPRRFGDRFS